MNFPFSPSSDFVRRVAFEVRSVIGQNPAFFFPLLRLKGKPNGVPVDSNTELVIEGFPRSANTFALVALTLFQDRHLRTAHHLHVPAQVIQASRHSIPCVVLIRKPEDAVLSQIIRNPFLTLSQVFREYNRFYRAVLPYKRDFVIAEFSDVVSNFSTINDRLERRFGLELKPFEHTDENLSRCYEEINRLDQVDTGRSDVSWATVARPSERRSDAKRILKSQLDCPSLQPTIRAARAVYDEFVSS